MRIGMSVEDIVEYLKRDEEASIYLDNALKKYSEEFYNFLKKLVELDISREKEDLEYQQELKEFVLELIIQRLRQLNCFGLPNKEYATKVFENTLRDVL